jgi:hypothetical protein
LIVAEVSMFKNIEYDLLNISKQMEHLDTQKDVEVFTEQSKATTENRIVAEAGEEEGKRTPPDAAALQLKTMVGKSMLSESLFYVEEEYFTWMLTNKVTIM